MYKFLGVMVAVVPLVTLIKHLNIFINIAIICLMLPVYFLKVCLFKIVWNDITNKQ
jgi:hypothetical protein